MENYCWYCWSCWVIWLDILVEMDEKKKVLSDTESK